jgi:hypothetical protein
VSVLGESPSKTSTNAWLGEPASAVRKKSSIRNGLYTNPRNFSRRSATVAGKIGVE